MTFYLHPYAYTQVRPARRLVRRWVENHQQTLGVNIREEEQAYILSALVPGLKAEDLNIQILDDVLKSEGEYRADENNYLLRELPGGSFSRTLRLPAPSDALSVRAKIAGALVKSAGRAISSEASAQRFIDEELATAMSRRCSRRIPTSATPARSTRCGAATPGSTSAPRRRAPKPTPSPRR